MLEGERGEAGGFSAMISGANRKGGMVELLPSYRLVGTSGPVVVILNGAGANMGYWRAMEPALAGLGRVLLYDRGLPSEYKAAPPPLGKHHVEQLRRLLAALALPPPYLLVAHSLGGLYADLFARLHPEEIAGLVLVDATHPEQEQRFAPQMNAFGRLFRALLGGWDRLFGPGPFTEVTRMGDIAAELAAAPPFPDIPLTVITAGRTPPAWMISPALWAIHLDNQRELVRLSPQGRQVMAERSGHDVPRAQPEIILAAIEDMLARGDGGVGDIPHSG